MKLNPVTAVAMAAAIVSAPCAAQQDAAALAKAAQNPIAGGQRWVVPLGLGIGQIMRFGKQPVNLQASAYYNVEKPDNAGNWQLRLQLQFLFPK